MIELHPKYILATVFALALIISVSFSIGIASKQRHHFVITIITIVLLVIFSNIIKISV